MTQNRSSTSVSAPMVVAQIGGSPGYAGFHSDTLRLPDFDPTTTYYAVFANASAHFTSVDGTSCSLQMSTNDGASFASIVSFPIVAMSGQNVGETTTTIPVATPSARLRFRLTCASATARTLTEATIGISAGSITNG